MTTWTAHNIVRPYHIWKFYFNSIPQYSKHRISFLNSSCIAWNFHWAVHWHFQIPYAELNWNPLLTYRKCFVCKHAWLSWLHLPICKPFTQPEEILFRLFTIPWLYYPEEFSIVRKYGQLTLTLSICVQVIPRKL